MICLDVGPGKKPVRKNPGEQWMTIQLPSPGNNYGEGDIKHDIRVIPWPVDHGSFDLVHASHVIEHIPWYETVDVLKEIRRILKPGGVVEIWVPDFRKIVEAYLYRRIPDNWTRHNKGKDFMLWTNGRIFAYGDESTFHKACFDDEHLEKCLTMAGFKHIERIENVRGHDHGWINLGRKATA